MANSKIIEMKAAQVTEIAGKLKNAESVVVFDYRGLTVAEVTDLRSQMRAAGVEYAVLKNGIVERAAKEAGIDDSFQAFLKGPSAFAFSNEDVVAPAKILKETIKKYKKCEIKGGIIEGAVSDSAAMNVLADLPSREQLIARMLGSMLSPITKLAIALDQIAQKAPAAAVAGEPAPAAEPAAEPVPAPEAENKAE